MERPARGSLLAMGMLLAACGTAKSGMGQQCPNWKEAMRKAERIAGCDAHHRGDPNNRCQAALKRCKGGCDICQFLGSGNRLEADSYVADQDEWAPITRVPIESRHLNGYDGIRAKAEAGAASRLYKFNWQLCNDAGFVDVLAPTIAHEAMHACVLVSFPGILDAKLVPPPGCSAEELENACVGK
jgi:hypothetical protein